VTTSASYDFNTSANSTATDPNGLVTTVNTRDAAMRPTLITYPTTATKSATYNDNTPSVSQSLSYDDGGTQKTVTSSTVCDDLGRVIQQVDASGAQVNTAYDVMGRVASRTNPFPAGGTPGGLTTYAYDALGRATTVTLPDTQTVQTTYSGNAVTVIDQVSRKIQRLTDGLGRLVTVNEQDVSNGQLTQATNYSYDYLGDLTQVDQGGQLRKYKYDAIGRLLYENIPEQSATINDGTGTFWTCKYTYTTFNAVYQKTDARGVVSTFAYDGLNRVSQVSYNTVSGVTTAPTVSYVYDYDTTYGTAADGMLVRVNVGTDYQERYTFDLSFRAASTIRTIGSRTYTTSYSRNQVSQATQLSYPSSRLINVSHDSIGRLTALSEPGNGPTWLSSVTYNNIGQLTADALGNGVIEQYGYDTNRMQLTSQKAGTASPYTNRMNLTYSYSAASGQMGSGSTAGNASQLMAINNNSTINGTTESAAYTYDNLGRLVTSNQTSNGSSAQRRFAYDRWGNRTGVWDATSGGSQIQSITLQGSGGIPTNQIASVTAGSTVNYTYDAAGNVTNDGLHSYTYDSENRLVSVDSGSTASYAYDHQNRRYKKTVGSTVTHYVWQGWHVIAEHNGSNGAVLTDYVYSGSRMIAKVASGTTQYLLSDRLSERLALDTSGNVSGRQAHLPFGEDFGESGAQEKHHFTSYERDSEQATDYAINRQYAVGVGRFNRPDPLSLSARNDAPQHWNRYSYTANEPVDQSDPTGLLIAAPGPCDNEGIPGYCPPWYPSCSCEGGEGLGGGFEFGGDGGDDDVPPVTCTIQVYDRLLEKLRKILPSPIQIKGFKHGYIVFTDPLGIPHFFEGIRGEKSKLGASESLPLDLPLPDDNPLVDRLDGEISGPQVCGWYSILQHDVDVVNASNIRWEPGGPNSSSVLRYMLQSLPDRSWFHMPYMIGYGHRLPGIE
jgi:RHS repeat-associated protein